MLLITQKAGRTGWPIMRDSYVLYSRVMICIFAHLTTFIAPLFHYNTPFLVLFTLLQSMLCYVFHQFHMVLHEWLHVVFLFMCRCICLFRPKRPSEDHQLGSCSLHRHRIESERERLAGEEKHSCSDSMRHHCCSACVTAKHSCASNHY